MEDKPPIDLDNVTPTDVPSEDNDFPTPNPTQTKRMRKERIPTARTPTPRAKKGQFVEPLTQMYTLIGIGVNSVDKICGPAIVRSAADCAKALDDLAYTNESVRRALLSLTTVSGYGQVILAHMPILFAIAAHHGGGFVPQAIVDAVMDNDETEEAA